MNISLILAASKNNVIGVDGELPWKLPVDMQWFKKHTGTRIVVMGRKTYESIGRLLPGRYNIIISGDKNWSVDNVLICRTVEAALEFIKDAQRTGLFDYDCTEAMIIGGGEIYRQFKPHANKIYWSTVDVTINSNESVTVDELDPREWVATHASTWNRDKKNNLSGSFYIFERNTV